MFKKYFDNRFIILYTIPFFIGSLTTLSFQPFNITIINFIVLPIFFYLIIYVNKKSKSIYRKKPYKINLFVLGLLFGFGFYLSGISWITNSLTFEENFKILIPFALIFIPLFLSIFMAINILIIGPFLKPNFSSIALFSGSLAFSDFIRSKILTGFPWNSWAYSTSWANELLQILNMVGFHSYNIFIITLFTLPVIIFFNVKLLKKVVFLTSGLLIILGLYIYGNYVINQNDNLLNETNDKVFVKIISPNFELEYGLSEEKIKKRLRQLIRYSSPDEDKKTLFIWPEGVFSGYSYKEILVFKEMISKSFSKDHFIVFGINVLDINSGKFYNSMLIVNNDFEIVQRYNKRKLVPFGEFLPFEDILNNFGLKKITEGHGSFLRGNKNNNLKIEEINILPLICYEVIFTDLIQKSDNTNIIINISEDGWFGKSVGPNQHFAKSIFRAIENNTYLLRSTNKGVSAIIDNKGNIIKQLNRNEAGNIEYDVPLIKSNKIKNDLIFYILLITYLVIFLIYKKENAK